VPIAALVVWCTTACFGLYLLAMWLSHGGLKHQATRITVFPAVLTFAHPLLAAVGLAFWVSFTGTGRPECAWAGFSVLSMSTMLGFAMLTRWLVGRGGRHARGAEQHFPVRAAAVHGLVGLGTYVLVLVTAIRA
jgi:hypothetical protein